MTSEDERNSSAEAAGYEASAAASRAWKAVCDRDWAAAYRAIDETRHGLDLLEKAMADYATRGCCKLPGDPDHQGDPTARVRDP